ncbi:unnamed protein product [Orchesella dallaii]|uniref:C2H2-type domain-containing protein n=1 Tax=Orchesella dallaii TaxID=48710 RepID=A0ABP1RX45_9HEXA
METPFLGMDGIRNYENEVQDEILKNAKDLNENVPAFNHAMTSNRSAFSAHQQKPSSIQLISNARKTVDEILSSRYAFKSASDPEDEVVDGGDDDGGGNSMHIKTRTKEKVTHAEEYEQVQVENDDESEDQVLLQTDTARIRKFDDVSHGGTTITSKSIREEGVLFPPYQPQNESTEGSHEDEENDSSSSPYNSQRSPTSNLVTEPVEGDEAIDANSDLEQNDNFQNLTTNLNERFLQHHLPHNLLQSRVPNFNEENASQISARNGKELEGTNSFSNLQSPTQTTVIYIPTPSPQLPLLETSLHIAAEERRPTLSPTSYGVEREKASLQHQKMGKRKVEKISSSLPPRKRIAATTWSYTTTIFKRMSRPILYRYRCTHCPAFFRRPQRIQSHSNLHLPSAYVEICRVNNCGWYVVPGEMARHYKQQHPGLQKTGEGVISKRDRLLVTRRYFQTSAAGNADPPLVPPANHPPPILVDNSRSEPLLPCIIQSEKGGTNRIIQSCTIAPPGTYRVIDGSPNGLPHQYTLSVGQLPVLEIHPRPLNLQVKEPEPPVFPPLLQPPSSPNGFGVANSEPYLAASVVLEESETRMEEVITQL